MNKLKIVMACWVVVFIGLTWAGACGGKELPRNPFLADSTWPITHGHPYNQASSPLPGPTGPAQSQPQLLPGEPVPITLAISSPYADGQRAVWGTTLSYVFKLDANQGQWRYIDKFPRQQSQKDAISGAYSLVDRDGRYYVPRGQSVEVFQDAIEGQLDTKIEKRNQFQLPGEVANADEMIIGLNMTFDGYLVFVTDAGLVGVVARELDDFESLRLGTTDQPVHVSNSIAVDEDGRIIVVTDQEVVAVRWDAQASSRLSIDWRVCYPTDDVRMNGRLGKGSGTTPSLMGTAGEDKLVAICDGRALMNVVLIWRDEIPPDWAGLPDRDRRIAAETPITFGQPDARQSTTEQSLTVWGHELVTVSNLYGELSTLMKRFVRRRMGNDIDKMTVYRSNTAAIAPYGVEKLAWDQRAKKLSSVWVRPDLSCPNGIPCMSGATGLLYFMGQRDGDWTLEAVDWRSGDSAFYQRLDNNSDYNSFYSGTQLGGDGTIMTGTLGGVLRFSSHAPPSEPVSQPETHTAEAQPSQ